MLARNQSRNDVILRERFTDDLRQLNCCLTDAEAFQVLQNVYQRGIWAEEKRRALRPMAKAS